MKEIWKDVVGLEDLFMVSNLGNIWSKRTEKILVLGNTKTGYKILSTKIGGRKGVYRAIKVHRMVAEAFIKNLENKPFVNHIDGNKKNNFYKNLEWCTQSENTKHAYKTGLIKILSGEDSPTAKLTKIQVEKIRSDYLTNRETHLVIAKRYGIERSGITNILNNVTYKN